MTDSNDTTTCPVCGQEYVHKRTDSEGNTILRNDMRQCKKEEPQSTVRGRHTVYTVYVHEGSSKP